MATLHHIAALVLKEFLAILKDPRSRSVVILPPLIQTFVFGYAATFDLYDIPFIVYDEDRSAASRALVAGFEGSPHFHRAGTVQHIGAARDRIDAHEALMVVHAGAGFERRLRAGATAPVQILVDGRNSNTAAIALNYANTIVSEFGVKWAAAHGRALPDARLVPRAWHNPNLESRWFIVPGIVAVLTLVVTLLVTALSVAREREHGTFDQLLVTPYRPVEILIGKCAPGFVIGFAEATLITLLAVYWFGVPLRGSVAALYLGVAVYLLSAVGVGLMISSMAATMQQGLLGAFLFLVPAVILSGFATPIANMPEAIQWVTLVNPLRYMLVVVRGIFLEGAPLALLLPQLWPMAVIGLVSLTLAGWLFRHRMY